ncbi:hypothetical protein CFE70_010278 [Pyrenophora teres f. teres 0-1]|uniref:SP-RING-type domain-containing protein n=1 Tax=Pyrenophora teres f. teres (strain 0-1) TaxID=861557 RepID=E3RFU5_PYRTT|nr:hypothetical protein PTT_06619 [Pyrenophora teres f. teres 0-1]
MVQNKQPLQDNDATARTLDYALGNLGGRRKSWMMPPAGVAAVGVRGQRGEEGATPMSPPIDPAELSANPLPFKVRGRGRPRKHPALEPPPSYRQSEPVPNSTSTSTSPRLPNLSVRHNSASHGPSAVSNAFPSPASSEETTTAVTDTYTFDTLQPHPPFAPPRPLSRPLLPAPSPAVAQNASVPTPQTPSINVHDWYTVDDCRTRLDAFCPPSSPMPISPLNASRLKVLRAAADTSDWYYLTMHQLYCMLTLCPSELPQSVRNMPGLEVAIDVMIQALSSNTMLSLSYLQFFSTFPYPLNHLVDKWPHMINYQLECFRDFVNHSSKFVLLRKSCETRMCPPLARELATNLKLNSPNFQRLLFLCILRRIWPVMDPMIKSSFEDQAVSIFQQSQMLFYRQITGQHQNQVEADIYEGFASAIKQLVETLLLAGQQSSASPLRLQQEQRQHHHHQHQQQIQQHHELEQWQRLPPGVFKPNYPLAQPLSRPPILPSYTQSPVIHQFQPGSLLNLQLPPRPPSNPQVQVQQSTNPQLPTPQSASHQVQAPQVSDLRFQAPQPVNPQIQASANTHAQQHNYPVSLGNRSEMPPRVNTSLAPHSAQAVTHQSRTPVRPTVPKRRGTHLLPPAGWQQPLQREPAPVRSSLHQAHLQSPVLRAKTISSPLYILQAGFFRRPERPSNPSLSVEKWNFQMSRQEINRLPPTNCAANEPVTRDIDQNNVFVRLRCIKWDKTEDPTDEAWAAADTKWIPRSYFSVNGRPLEQRKKMHHGKDMPIDITHLVTEGENTLEFTVLTSASDKSHHDYSIAVEVVGVISHDSIREHVTIQNFVPAEQVLAAIKKQLSNSTNDDDIAIVSESTLTITLFDPFYQSRYCDIPVRAKSCPHNDCFDLETFLSTRARKGDTSVVDQWRCPICRGDARPHTLFVDGFVKEVCEKFPKMGLGNTRTILVEKSGRWRPKQEVREGVCDDDVEREAERERAKEKEQKKRSFVPDDVEVIDLCD